MKINKSLILSLILLGGVSTSINAEDTTYTVKQTGNQSVDEFTQKNYEYLKTINSQKQKEVKDFNEASKDMPVKIGSNDLDVAQGEASWSLVNEECKPQMPKVSGVLKDMMGRVNEARDALLDPELWKGSLMNSSMEQTINAYAHYECMSSSANQKELQALISQCQAQNSKNVTNTDTGSVSGTMVGQVQKTVFDASSMGAAASCLNDKKNEKDAQAYQKCYAEKQQQFRTFLNGSISDSLNFGLQDLQIQHQKCAIANQNNKNKLQDLILDGHKIVDARNVDPGQPGSGIKIQIDPETGEKTYVSDPSSKAGSGGGGGSSGNMQSTGTMVHIKTDGSMNNPKSSLDGRAKIFNQCLEEAETLWNLPSTLETMLDKESREGYAVMYTYWCSAIFYENPKMNNLYPYAQDGYDIHLIDGRWDFPYVADFKTPQKDFPFLKNAKDKVSVYEECKEMTDPNPLTTKVTSIIDKENGKHPDQYKEVVFDGKKVKNRLNYFIYSDKTNKFKSLFDPEKKEIKDVGAFRDYVLYLMRNKCSSWVKDQITILGFNPDGSDNLIKDGKAASDITLKVDEKLSDKIYKERMGRYNMLKVLQDDLNNATANYERTKGNINLTNSYSTTTR